ALAFFDADHHAVGVDVADPDLHGLGDAQPRPATEHESIAILQTAHVTTHPADFLRAEYDGELVPSPDAGKTLFPPRHFQRNEVEKLHGGNEQVDALR